MALTPYSVSPFLVDQRVLPNPIMYWVTRTLNSLAGTRWPLSWRAMDTAIAITMMRMPATARRIVMQAPSRGPRAAQGQLAGMDRPEPHRSLVVLFRC